MSINTAIREIRDTANRSVYLCNVKRHGFSWDMVCASMDVIEDTQLAISAYEHTRKEDTGQCYLDLYGLFQAMFMQQDAVINLAEGLNIDPVQIWKDPDSKRVRTVRTKYFGHPTRRKDGKKVTYHGITRMTVGATVIQGWTYPKFQTESIDIADTLKQHASTTKKTLEDILEKLKQKGDTYMAQFTEDLPVSDHDYDFQKLYAWALGTANGEVMASAAVDILGKELDRIEAGVRGRYDDADKLPSDIMREIGKAKYCVKVLHKGLAEDKSDTKSSFYFEAHIDALQQTYTEIAEICKGINGDFHGSKA